MRKIEDLLRGDIRSLVAPIPEVNALTLQDALAEAHLLEVNLDLIRADLWLLFDCRGALDANEGNTAIVQIAHVRRMEWSGEPPSHRWVWSVAEWHPIIEGNNWTIVATFDPDGTLTARGSMARYIIGDIDRGNEAPPDFAEATDEEIRAGFASWDSLLEVKAAAQIEVTAGRIISGAPA